MGWQQRGQRVRNIPSSLPLTVIAPTMHSEIEHQGSARRFSLGRNRAADEPCATVRSRGRPHDVGHLTIENAGAAGATSPASTAKLWCQSVPFRKLEQTATARFPAGFLPRPREHNAHRLFGSRGQRGPQARTRIPLAHERRRPKRFRVDSVIGDS